MTKYLTVTVTKTFGHLFKHFQKKINVKCHKKNKKLFSAFSKGLGLFRDAIP